MEEKPTDRFKLPCQHPQCKGKLIWSDRLLDHHKDYHSGRDNTCKICEATKKDGESTVYSGQGSLTKHIRHLHAHLFGFTEPMYPIQIDASLNVVEDIKARLKLWEPRLGLDRIQNKRIRKENYLLYYDFYKLRPIVTVEVLTPASIKTKDSNLQHHHFPPGGQPPFKITPLGFKSIGFEMGHLVAAGNHCYNNEMLRETFDIKNAAAMYQGFNAGSWNVLENQIRMTAPKWDETLIVTGAIWNEEKKHLAAGYYDIFEATHFYKVVIFTRHEETKQLCFLMPHVSLTEKCFFSTCSLQDIRKMSGLNILPNETIPQVDFSEIAIKCQFRKCYTFFSSRAALNLHLKQKHAASFECYLCFDVFLSEPELTDHKNNHVKYTCPRCSKEFLHQYELDRHSHVHANAKEFQCYVCYKSYASEQELSDHKDEKHKRKRKFPCDECDLGFDTPSRLKRHKSVHSVATPFKCPVSKCTREFKRKDGISRHLKISHQGWVPVDQPRVDQLFV